MANIININGSKKPSNSLVSTLTAEAANVRSGKTFIGKNNRDTQTGTMPNAVVITPTGKSATAKVTGLTYSYNSTNDNFTIAHSSQASATVSVQPSVSTAGYISSSEGTKTANNVTAYGQVAATVAKVKTGVDITGTTTMQPSISRTAKPSGDTWTDAASGAATTTKPTSGVYVQVNSAANTGTLTATPKVTTAGYGTTAYYGATAGTKTVGASASDATYVPIKTATPAFTGGAVSGSVSNITGSNVTLSDTNNGISVTAAASATRAAVLYNGAVNGYVVKADNVQALAASSATTLTGKTRYITAITVPKDKVFELTAAADTALDDNSTIMVHSGGYRKIVVENGGSTEVNNNNTTDEVTVHVGTGSALIYGDEGTTMYQSTGNGTGSGSLLVNSYYNGNQEGNWNIVVVNNGNWVQNTVTPTTSVQGPFYGRTTVNAVSLTGNAAPGDVLRDKLFYNTSLTAQSGTMPNRGAVTATIRPSTTYIIPQGYHNGNGAITAGPVKYVYKAANNGTSADNSPVLTVDSTTDTIYYAAAIGGTSAYAYTIRLQYSDDNSKWTTYPGASSTRGTNGRGGYISGSATGHLYYRIHADANSSNTCSWGGAIVCIN